jgi:hypothetical protein
MYIRMTPPCEYWPTMTSQNPQGDQAHDNVPARDANSPPLNADQAGVSMAAADFNAAHAAAKKSEGSEFTPSTESSILHDFTIAGKGDYGNWTDKEAQRLGLVENNQDRKEENAFRHAFTAALYTIKYGESTTLELGWANEQKDFNIINSLRGKIDFDKISDTNTDLLNNRNGVAIAKELIKEKGEGNVTVKDIEDRVVQWLRAGKLVDHPDHELRSGKLAPEILSYHSMPGLIKWESKNGPTEEDREKAQDVLKARHME